MIYFSLFYMEHVQSMHLSIHTTKLPSENKAMYKLINFDDMCVFLLWSHYFCIILVSCCCLLGSITLYYFATTACSHFLLSQIVVNYCILRRAWIDPTLWCVRYFFHSLNFCQKPLLGSDDWSMINFSRQFCITILSWFRLTLFFLEKRFRELLHLILLYIWIKWWK